MSIQHLDFGSLRAAYKDGTQTPHELVDQIFQRIDERKNDGVWITIVDRETALNRTKDLESIPVERRDAYPLYGFPFSVKDNITDSQEHHLEVTRQAPFFRPLTSSFADLSSFPSSASSSPTLPPI